MKIIIRSFIVMVLVSIGLLPNVAAQPTFEIIAEVDQRPGNPVSDK